MIPEQTFSRLVSRMDAALLSLHQVKAICQGVERLGASAEQIRELARLSVDCALTLEWVTREFAAEQRRVGPLPAAGGAAGNGVANMI